MFKKRTDYIRKVDNNFPTNRSLFFTPQLLDCFSNVQAIQHKISINTSQIEKNCIYEYAISPSSRVHIPGRNRDIRKIRTQIVRHLVETFATLIVFPLDALKAPNEIIHAQIAGVSVQSSPWNSESYDVAFFVAATSHSVVFYE